MSDWLELELTRDLAPVAAPHALSIRLGFAPTGRPRWVFPRIAIAVAAAVVMVIGGGYAASQTAARDARSIETVVFASADPAAIAAWLHREAGMDVPMPPADGVQLTGARIVRRRGERVAEKATVLVARAGTPTAAEAACHFCHTL